MYFLVLKLKVLNSDHFIFRAAYVAYFRCLNIVDLSKDFNYPEDQITEATLHFLLFQKSGPTTVRTIQQKVSYLCLFSEWFIDLALLIRLQTA